ncbi:MAG: type II toxin-antitoxin system RelB/DinJ family antitoxin [Coriobacteriia bacterium]|nr:type II toxin-antitoxin system RelB/DinJ family antitoxin [Coriobacteriia bacterium]
MAKRAVINIRADEETKTAVEQLYKQFGITVSDAVNLFFAQSLQEQSLPFQVRIASSQRKPAVLSLLKQRIAAEAAQLFGDKLQEVRLYGSYARGDYDDESDIDFALIVEVERERLGDYHAGIVEIADAASIDFGVAVSINAVPAGQYHAWSSELPYYQAIKDEGEVIHA